MSKDREILTGEHFMNGNVACAEGAIAAGCRFFAGYPITPSSEIAERISERFPEVGGIFIQMEDELASMCAILGASWGGIKSMTCTSGPGFSLMQENLGLGVIMETPCVLVNIQRGGPSTGLPTLVGQQDMMQARWGSHGDYEIIALCPSSPQELFDFTIKAFNLSEMYRVPVLIMSDEVVGHMSERVVIPPKEKIDLLPRRMYTGSPEEYLPFKPDKDLVPPMVIAGEGYHIHITGLTHDEKGYPVIDAETQNKLVPRLVDKIKKNAKKIIEIEETNTEDAEVIVVSYGISARTSLRAIELAEEEGIRVGILRLITVWPFPEERIHQLASKVAGFVVPEINLGQIVYEIERCAKGKTRVTLVPHAGGHIHDPKDIFQAIRSIVK